MMPDVSVVIVNYHTFTLTCDCIRSVVEKTKSISYEIILVDNGSKEQESNDFQSLFPNVVYVKAGANLGFSKGNNLGISRASGEYVLLLNSDTVLLNDAASLAVEVFRGDESVGVVSGQLRYPDGRKQAVAGRFPLLSRVVKDLVRATSSYDRIRRASYYLGEEWDYNKPVEADWVWGAFLMFRKKDIEKFPGKKLHDDFFMYFEDVQWCYYFKLTLGRKVVYSPEPQVIHFIGKSGDDSNEADKYFKTILPNEHKWMKMTRGAVYTSLYYFLKGIYYFSLRRAEDVAKGKKYIKYTFR